MAGSPFQAAIEALLRPLEFAARDGFAHVGRVRDLAPAVSRAARDAAGLHVPRDVARRLADLAERFDASPEEDALERGVTRALDGVRPLADPRWAEAALARSPEALPGVGPKTARLLAGRGLDSVGALLFHLPSRWDDRRSLSRVGELEVGRRVTFAARVAVCDFVSRRGRRGRTFEAVVADETGTINLKWFRSGESIARQVRKDAWLLVTGDVRRYRFSKEIVHPEIELLAGPDASQPEPPGGAGVVADYATPEGLHPRALRRALGAAVEEYSDLVRGFLPAELIRRLALPSPADALRQLHRPADDVDLEALREGRHPARTRLVLEELYLLEVGLALRRASRGREAGVAIDVDGPRTRAAPEQLPFTLTGAQRRAWDELRADLSRPHPMNRLLEGDVGSGKTVVAFLAALAVGEGGHQTALMAPTELLAEQHARTLRRLCERAGDPPPLRMALLTASLPRAEAQRVREGVAAGEIDLVVGTHALVQQGVAFHRLAFVVIDEQHRFGVRQRAALAAKAAGGRPPHVLVMTATPIPRTLALTVWGDLDLSVLDELPPGRRPVRTLLLRPGDGERLTGLLREVVERGEQVYVVYPLVEESEKVDLRAASESAERIAAAFPGMRVDLVHGRLPADARAAAMARFEAGETQVLVSTTVVEVGVDVPNATLMVVEHAERFGLAQLHQLRGRVGRAEKPGTCVLMARGSSPESEARLAAILRTTDGFEIAEADLSIRGPGEFLGTRQHGPLLDLRLADLVADARLVVRAREAALETLRRDPGLARDPELRRAVEARWGERLELAGTG